MTANISILLFAALMLQCKPKEKKEPASFSPQWELVWSDEFNGSGLPNISKWNYDTGGHGWGNNEAQYYTKNEPKNAKVEKGNLVITALKEKINSNNYSSARLITKGKGDWCYGKIEVKAKLPKGRGTWPAIWMLASTNPLQWPADGEIDIMEHVGFNPGRIHFTVHTKKYNHSIGTQKSASAVFPNTHDVFHIYAITWNNEKIEWFVNGNKTFEFVNDGTGNDAWPFNKPFHILLNIAVGGNWGGRLGIDETVFPQQMLIDYVRVYQRTQMAQKFDEVHQASQ